MAEEGLTMAEIFDWDNNFDSSNLLINTDTTI